MEPTVIELWDEIPGYNGGHKPVLEFYPAENKKGNGAIIIFPGGGYAIRAEHEGKGYAEYLTAEGIDCFVLQYRVAPDRFPYPLLDARRAVRYVRANAEKYGIESEKFSNFDLHVHVPEGATPKDGPSAGITMATAILSAFTGTPVRGDVAMTGEITLRGKVLPIGGLKEKSLAARRLGIKTVIIPYENKREIEELPAVVQKDVSFIPVKSVDEVFDIMLGDNQSKANPAKNSPKKTKSLPVIPTQSSQDSVRCL
jgi:hypothetical protein